MAKKWQKDITVTLATSQVVEIPAAVGKVQVALDFSGTGSGTAVQSKYTYADAVADTDATQWIALSTAISSAVADTVGNTSEFASAVKLSAATADQRFVLTGEHANAE